MILSHDPSKTWGESLLCSLALAKRRHKQGYDAVKLTAACGIPGPEKGLPGGVANTASYQKTSMLLLCFLSSGMDSYKIEIRYHEAGPLFQCVRPHSCDFDGKVYLWINRKFFD